jgi:hypothetical protein
MMHNKFDNNANNIIKKYTTFPTKNVGKSKEQDIETKKVINNKNRKPNKVSRS